MVYAFTNTTQDVASNAAVTFNTSGVQAGETTYLSNGTVNIRVPGLYLINFNADVTSSVVGNAEFQLTLNGSAVAGAVARTSIDVASDVRNVGFSAVVRIPFNCGCNSYCTANPYVIGITSSGIATTLLNTAITVTKVS